MGLLIGLLLSQYSSDSGISGSNRKRLSFKVAFIFISLFLFFQHFFFISFIKTELATIDKAEIISNYDQIEQNPHLKVKWITYDTVYTKFQNAPPGSVKNQLWLRSQPDAMVTPTAQLSQEKFFKDLIYGRVVAIGHWVTMSIIHAAMCPIARFFLHRRLLVKRYVTGDEIPACSVYNDRMDKRIVKYLAKRVTASVEFNTKEYLTSTFEAPYHVATAASKEDVIACREEHGQDAGQAVVPQKVMKDFHSLFVMWFGVTAFSFIMLLCEYCACMIRRKMSRRSHNKPPDLARQLVLNRRRCLTAPPNRTVRGDQAGLNSTANKSRRRATARKLPH